MTRSPRTGISSSLLVLLGMGLLAISPLQADSTTARCDLYAAGSDQLETMTACNFSQRQGYITITLADGQIFDLSPEGDTPGNFKDQKGQAVYRQSGLGDQGLIFRFPDQSVFVYWDTTALEPADESSPTWPFTTEEYDATALFRCQAPGETEAGQCPGGIMRMESQQASITVRNQLGETFTINFMTDYVNATNRELTAELVNDTWILDFANGERWEIPRAAVEGG